MKFLASFLLLCFVAPLLRWGVAIIVFVDVVFYGSSVEVGNMKLCEISILVFAIVSLWLLC